MPLSGKTGEAVEDALGRVLRTDTNMTTPHIQDIQKEVKEAVDEHDPPKGPLGSITVLSGVGGLGAGITQLVLGYRGNNTEMFYTGAVTIVASIGAIIGRIRASKVVRMVKTL